MYYMYFRILCIFFITCLCFSLTKSQEVDPEVESESGSNAETKVRFCLNGWHQWKKPVCPFGIVFMTPKQVNCFYGLGSAKPNLYETVCTAPSPLKYIANTDLELEADGGMVFNYESIQLMDYIDNFSNETEPGYGVGFSSGMLNLFDCDCPDLQSDSSEETHDDSRETEEQEDFTDSLQPWNKANAKELADQTLRLNDYLFDRLHTIGSKSFDGEDLPDLYVIKIFKKSIEVLTRLCLEPFLPYGYLNRVFYGFLFLVQDFGIEQIRDVEIEEFEDIMEELESCHSRGPKFRLEGRKCSNKALVHEIVAVNEDGGELSASFDATEYPFDIEKYDLFIESAWRVIDSIHGACFQSFRSRTNMHHRYQTAMETLFTPKIQHRWVHPTELNEIEDWDTWFLSDVQSTMDNVQACVRGAYVQAPFATRLDRPVDHKRIRRRREVKHDNSNPLLDFYGLDDKNKTASGEDSGGDSDEGDEVTSSTRKPKPNFPDWEEYEATGGVIMHLGSKVMKCLKTKEERDKTLANLRRHCITRTWLK